MEAEQTLDNLATQLRTTADKLDVRVGNYSWDSRTDGDGYTGDSEVNSQAVAALKAAAESLDAWTGKRPGTHDIAETRRLLNAAAYMLQPGQVSLSGGSDGSAWSQSSGSAIDSFDTGVTEQQAQALRESALDAAANMSRTIGVNLNGPDGPEVFLKARIERRPPIVQGQKADIALS